MKLTPQLSKLLLIGTVLVCLLFTACQSKPKTNLECIDALKKQVVSDAKTLNELQDKDFVQLQKTFITCDSMLQYLHPETVDEIFDQLQLVDAYLAQFKTTRPLMQADMDSTLIQLDNLKSDLESHFLSDSLAAVYLETETQHVELLSNQVKYFKERLESCQNDLNELKEKMWFTQCVNTGFS